MLGALNVGRRGGGMYVCVCVWGVCVCTCHLSIDLSWMVTDRQ